MLVLTRKVGEQIVIGDDIKVMLVRSKGNAVRIGIEAPREVRIVRGEIADKIDDVEHDPEDAFQPSEREMPFAHSQPKPGSPVSKSTPNVSRQSTRMEFFERQTITRPASGNVQRASDPSVRGGDAPLSGFMSAS